MNLLFLLLVDDVDVSGKHPSRIQVITADLFYNSRGIKYRLPCAADTSPKADYTQIYGGVTFRRRVAVMMLWSASMNSISTLGHCNCMTGSSV